MARFVLVHGGWHGGWCWVRVADRLRAAGHEVWTPTLTGYGERSHQLSREVDVHTHIEDVVAVFRFERIADAVLVGHSYAGAVIGGVVDRIPERIRHAVYLDAMLLDSGESLFDALPDFAEAIRGASTDGWSSPSFPAEFFGVSDPADREWVDSLLTPLPIATLTTPVRMDNPAAASVPATFVACVDPAIGIESMAQRARSRGWSYAELATGHDAMVSDPDGLTRILTGVVAPSA